MVVVAAVDDRDDPGRAEVYRFDDRDEVREHFAASYRAKIEAGKEFPDHRSLWINLDKDDRGVLTSAGAGLAGKHPPAATYPLGELLP